MRGAIVAMVLVAACGGSGVDLEVTYGEHFDSVEVFIGTEECTTIDPATQQSVDCPGVAWKAGQIRPDGDVYVMKPDEKIISLDQVNGTTATIHLEATDEYRQPRVIAIVAFVGDAAVAFSTLHDVRIPANSAEHWTIALDKAAVASDDVKTAPPDGEPEKRVYAWARERVSNPETLSRCLAMQFWDDGDKLWKSKFIVPDSDPDCDGQDIECDPLYTDFNVGGAAHACVTRAPNISMEPCAIGGSQCADGIRATDACTLPPLGLTCIPDAACTACEGAPEAISCLVDTFGALPPDPTLAAFKCTFNFTDGGSPCVVDQASNTAAFYLPVACKDVVIRDLTTPLANNSSPHTANIGNPGMATVDATVSTTTDTCLIRLRWNGGTVDTSGPTGRTYLFIISSATTTNVLAVPVRLEFSGPSTTCSSSVAPPGQCTSTPNAQQDSMYQCLL